MENITVTFSPEQEHEPIFTRYLYIVPDVYASLLDAIEQKKRDEALFWAYELYYSGFENELVRFLEKYIQQITLSNQIRRFIEKKINILSESHCDSTTNSVGKRRSPTEFRRLNKKDPLIATIIVNMIAYIREKNIFINYSDKDIEEFQTVKTTQLQHWKVLRTVCLYPSKKDYVGDAHPLLKHHHTREEYTKIFREDWEYYAYFTPVWKQRIEKYGGLPDHESRKIIWTRGEDDMELFYDKFGYEPDEQPIEVFHKLIN